MRFLSSLNGLGSTKAIGNFDGGIISISEWKARAIPPIPVAIQTRTATPMPSSVKFDLPLPLPERKDKDSADAKDLLAPGIATVLSL